MGGRPEDDVEHRPERGRVWNIDFGDGKQAAENLRGKAKQPEVHEAKPKKATREAGPQCGICSSRWICSS